MIWFYHSAKTLGGLTPIILDCFMQSIKSFHKASLLSINFGVRKYLYIRTSVPPFSIFSLYLLHSIFLNDFHHLANAFGGLTPIILDCFMQSIKSFHKASLLSINFGVRKYLYIRTSVPPFSIFSLYLLHSIFLNDFHHLANAFGGLTPIILDCFMQSIKSFHKASLLSINFGVRKYLYIRTSVPPFSIFFSLFVTLYLLKWLSSFS